MSEEEKPDVEGESLAESVARRVVRLLQGEEAPEGEESEEGGIAQIDVMEDGQVLVGLTPGANITLIVGALTMAIAELTHLEE